MNGEDRFQSLNAMIFLLEKDPGEREAMRDVVAGMGCAVIAQESIAGAEALLKNGAACNLLIVSTTVMDTLQSFDRLLAAAGSPPPPVVIYGVDPAATVVLHCLNQGARDFLTKPFDRDDLIHAVENALMKEQSGSPAHPDSIVASQPLANWIELTASSELEQFRRIQRFSDSLFASNFPRAVCEDLKMAVEEVGRNAVEWGNRFDPDKQVHVSYCVFDDRVVIKVEDEGEGFKPQSVPDPTADPVKTMQDRAHAGKRPGGYGVYLMRKLVDDIVYNEKGNTVLLIKYLPGRDSGPSGLHRTPKAEPAT